MAEPTYPIKNTITGKSDSVTRREYEDHVNARDSSGNYIWKPTVSMLGILTAEDGSTEEVMIPPERQRDALFGDSTKRPMSIWEGPTDPRREQARQSTILSAQKKIAQERGVAEVAAHSALSTASFGQSSRAINAIAGEDSGKFLGLSTHHNTMPHLMGSMAGAALLGSLPIPGLGAAGRALTGGAKGAANVGTIFEASAALSQTARGLVTGKGFVAEFGKTLIGTTAFAAAAELPISAAMVAADIVDHNQELTWESVLEGGFQQYQWALGIAAVTSLPIAAIGAGIRMGARKGVTKAGQLVEQGRMAGFADSVKSGSIRRVMRPYRGSFFTDIAETHFQKVGGRLVKNTGKNVNETKIGRLLAGADADDFMRHWKNNREAYVALSEAQTARQYKRATEGLQAIVKDPEIARKLNYIHKHADDIAAARRISNDMVRDGARMAEVAIAQPYKHPIGLTSPSKVTHNGREMTVRAMLKDVLKQTRQVDGLSEAAAKAIDKGIRANNMSALDDVLNIRKGVPPGAARIELDKAINKGFQAKAGKKSLPERLAEIDGFEDAAVALRGQSAAIRNTPRQAAGLHSLEQLQKYRATLQKLHGTYRGLSDDSARIINKKPFTPFFDRKGKAEFFKIGTKFDELEEGVTALGHINDVTERLSADAKPMVRAPKPGTQQEILLAQVDAVMTTKQRIASALEFIAFKGGGGRHTTVFGGVFAFREMNSMAEKREAFALYSEIVTSTSADPYVLQEHVGQAVENAANVDMPMAVGLAEGIATANTYLVKQLPTSADPMIGPGDFSAAEMENFLEAVGAIASPISVLASAADGSTSSQAVDALRTTYPELYVEMVLDVAEFMEERGHTLGHAQLMGLDTFTGGALGYTDAPGPNLAYGLPGYQTSQQAASAGAVGGPENRRMTYQQNATAADRLGGL